ncbi:MAG: cytochrome c biogenesis protein ResB [Deltaproteobacteria bacterium]|nr:cytochrome c biogenesis protein ResB [Deltaproteobacteria bacterium]
MSRRSPAEAAVGSTAGRAARGGPLGAAWAIFASTRTTAFLAILFSLTAFVAAVIPQGQEAIDLARDIAGGSLHTLVAWGLTDIFLSPWFKALAALLGGNLLAIAVDMLFGQDKSGEISLEPPSQAPHEREIETRSPEIAPELVREVLSSRLGPPRVEAAQGARVLMVFDSGTSVALAPLFAHLGLMLLVLGAGLQAASFAGEKGLARARLAITDAQTRTTGHFDLVAGEVFQFFQYPARYVLRDYVPSREGLGPAVRLERIEQGQQGGMSFWIYAEAPAGFDQRHRQGEVLIESEWMGTSALPGRGPSGSPLGLLMLFGFGLVAFGALFSQRARGRVWVDAEGDRVRMLGVPHAVGDPDFAADFDRWSLSTRAALES